MRKIQDIRHREKRIAAPLKIGRFHDEDLFSDGNNEFWGGRAEDPLLPKKVKKDNSIFYRVLAIVTICSSLTMVLFGRAYTVKAIIELDSNKTKEAVYNSLGYLKDGDINAALAEAKIAKSNLDDTIIHLQSWGQNSSYLQLIKYDSDYVVAEEQIDIVNTILDLCTNINDQLENYKNTLSNYDLSSGEDINLPSNIDEISSLAESLERKISLLETTLQRSNSNKLFSGNEQKAILDNLSVIKESINRYKNSSLPIIKSYLGQKDSKNIMLLFQNNAELRGSGGFMGSYAIIHTESGNIKKIDFQTNIYKLDKNASGTVDIDAPDELKTLANGKLYLRDSNFAIDASESFKNVTMMYKLESGENIDGIVAIDTTLFTQLLKVVGPITMEKYGLVVNSDNFMKEVQTEVEQNYFNRDGAKVENEPKKILSEMMPKFVAKLAEKLNDSQETKEIVQIISDCAIQKHIILYSSDSETQARIQKFNLGAVVDASTEHDYLYSHSTNVGGGKSSLNMTESITDDIKINAENGVTHNIDLIRTHNGDGQWPDYYNINNIRLLISKNASLEKFDVIKGNFIPHKDNSYKKEPKYKISDEANRQKVTFWMNTEPKKDSELRLKIQSLDGYKRETGKITYSLLVQKQPGTLNYPYVFNITAPEGWKFAGTAEQNHLSIKTDLDKDKLIQIELVSK